MYLLPSMKVNSKWIRDLSVKNKQTIQLLEESREEFLFTLKKKHSSLMNGYWKARGKKKNFFLIHLKKNHQAERQLTDAQHIDIST